MAINTGSFGKALWPGVNKWYGDAYDEYPVEWTKVFKTFKSRKAWEEDILYSGLGLAAVKGEGAPIQYDQSQQGFIDRYTHVQYGLGFIITKEMVEDDQYDIIGQKKASALAFSARQTKEVITWNLFNRAFNANYTFGDGVTLLNTAHPNQAGGTWTNRIAVDVDLTEAALEQATIDIAKYTNDRGLRIQVMPEKLVVPVEIMYEADKIMDTQYEVGTNNNTVNIVRSKFPGGVVVSHYLTVGSGVWFITTNVADGLKVFERRADTFSYDDDFDTDNAKYKFTTRYSVGCTDKRALYGSQGA